MESAILVLHVLVAVLMIGLILLQQGKGAEAGASFGAGASQTVFGSAGNAGFLTKATAVLAAIFFITSLGLAIYARKHAEATGILQIPGLEQTAPADAPKPAGDAPVAPAQKAPADAPVAPAAPK